MNKWEREVQASLFSSEEDALKALEQEYKRTLQSIMDQVKLFDADIQMLDDAIVDGGGTDEALMSQRQSKAYQRQFQNNLKAQIEAILDKLHSDEYSTINDYLNGCYKDAFVGSEYALAMQGVPVITPVRPEAVTKAVLLDSKVVKGYYARIGIDINKLKPKIASEITRGIASAMSYSDIARNLDNVSGSGLYNAKRIVRTEGHRIQQAAWMDSAEDAKAHGADLVRVWSSALDSRTRETHRTYDGEIAEVGGKFKLNGRDVDAPGYFGIPSEDCNCRCVALSRPRWALNDPVRKNDGFNGKIREFETPDDYEDFKEKYWGKDNTNYMDYLSQLEQKYGTKDYQTLLGLISNKEYTKLNRLENASPMWKIRSPIMNRNNAVGNPRAVAMFDVDLNKNQISILDKLSEYNSSVIVDKSVVSMNDLSALTAKTGCEFAMFTRGSKRLIIRGNTHSVEVNIDKAKELAHNGYKWSGHTHPGYDNNCLIASGDDYEILKAFGQKQSVTYNSVGGHLVYELE